MSSGSRISVTVASVLAFAGAAVVFSRFADAQAPVAGAAAAVSTPRAPDGHPDLSGYWAGKPHFDATGLVELPSRDPSSDVTLKLNVRNGDFANLTNDNVIAMRSELKLPLYKPQHWDAVLDNDLNGNLRDPFNSCFPIAPPRLQPPARIIQTATDIILQHTVVFHRNETRVIPIGPRKHPVDRDGTWTGDPAAHWDGDTLVIETVGFNDQSWLEAQGYIHGYELKVIERLRREGDVIYYDVTADDPEYLQEPWVLPTNVLRPITTPGYRLQDSPPCSERDNEHMVSKNREM